MDVTVNRTASVWTGFPVVKKDAISALHQIGSIRSGGDSEAKIKWTCTLPDGILRRERTYKKVDQVRELAELADSTLTKVDRALTRMRDQSETLIWQGQQLRMELTATEASGGSDVRLRFQLWEVAWRTFQESYNNLKTFYAHVKGIGLPQNSHLCHILKKPSELVSRYATLVHGAAGDTKLSELVAECEKVSRVAEDLEVHAPKRLGTGAMSDPLVALGLKCSIQQVTEVFEHDKDQLWAFLLEHIPEPVDITTLYKILEQYFAGYRDAQLTELIHLLCRRRAVTLMTRNDGFLSLEARATLLRLRECAPIHVRQAEKGNREDRQIGPFIGQKLNNSGYRVKRGYLIVAGWDGKGRFYPIGQSNAYPICQIGDPLSRKYYDDEYGEWTSEDKTEYLGSHNINRRLENIDSALLEGLRAKALATTYLERPKDWQRLTSAAQVFEQLVAKGCLPGRRSVDDTLSPITLRAIQCLLRCDLANSKVDINAYPHTDQGRLQLGQAIAQAMYPNQTLVQMHPERRMECVGRLLQLIARNGNPQHWTTPALGDLLLHGLYPDGWNDEKDQVYAPLEADSEKVREDLWYAGIYNYYSQSIAETDWVKTAVDI